MKVGTMEIVGTINIENIKSGITQMKNSLESAKVQAKSLFGDMERLGSSVKKVGKTMAVAGTGFLASLTAIATASPGVTSALERTKFEMFRIGLAVGNVLTPAFNKFVDMLGGVADFAENHPWATIIIGGIGSIASTIIWKLGVGSVARGAITGFISLLASIPTPITIEIMVVAGAAIATILYIKSLLDSLKEKREIEIEARGGFPKEAFEPTMMGEGTATLKPGYYLPITPSGPGMTPEEAGMIFAENVIIQTSNPIRESS